VVHDCRAFGTPHCTFANGLAMPVFPPSPLLLFAFPPPNKPSVFGSDTLPNPALRMAYLVPSELNILIVVFAVGEIYL
jgi:hypothetical protein